MPMDAEHKTILLIEDNRGDIRLIQEALKSAGVPCDVSVARDGVEAMAYLHRQGEFAMTKLPD